MAENVVQIDDATAANPDSPDTPDATGTANAEALMRDMGARARAAGHALSLMPAERKSTALHAAAATIRENAPLIIAANEKDMAFAKEKGVTGAMLDRLLLDDARIEAMAAGIDAIADFADPVGTVLEEWERPNGLSIQRVRVPLGVIGVIYESRPNVTADAGALCVKAGNAVILRGGSESLISSVIIAECLRGGLSQGGLPADAIQIVATRDRAAVGAMLRQNETIDVIVPRGGRSLIERVMTEARMPVFAHLEGLCHTYLDRAADPKKAHDIVMNAKMRRTGICGAMETLLVDRPVAETLLPGIADDLIAKGCELRGDEAARTIDSRIAPAGEEDWQTEYLDAILSIRVVDGLGEAVAHINRYGSHHTDAIVTEDTETANAFLNEVDSAICVHNASTQFADGGEFGMGAEIGISTGRMHARGPVGAEQLTSFKYVLRGNGQCRP